MPTKTRSRRRTKQRNPSSRERSSFNPREAAYFADVSVRQVNKAIEEKVLKPWRPATNRVYLQWDDVLTLALIDRIRLQLPRQTKKQIHNWVRSTVQADDPRPGELALSDVLVIHFDTNLISMAKQLDRYRERRERYITTDPEIQSGDPVISGTRLPVASVAERLRRGDSIDDLSEDYPGVPKTAFEAARIYADAHPRRGRPARPWRDVG
jgi:uncharacterized protein (DUF433 family)